jgi:hypothetical protein|tara:strand:- start:11070 stop:11327 length:258 start_codon:yes stop_codon:yes gene_type:complete
MDSTPQEDLGRTAWRGLLVPLVGSAAFFSSSLAGVIRTYQKYGWPKRAFTLSDYFLLSLPFLIIPLTLHETVKNGHKAEALDERK